MRVTSGIRKGAILVTSPDLSVRPTTDKVKQSIFNMIQFEIAGRNVLDLFSGSGSMGIEALSRGASSCTFVDLEPSYTMKNIEKLRFGEMATIIKSDYLSFLGKCEKSFDLVFLDPPYQNGMIEKALAALLSRNCLLPGSIVVWECDASETILPPAEISIRKEKQFGNIRITIGEKI